MVAVCVSAGIISGMTVGSGRVELCAGGCMTRGIPGIFCDIFPVTAKVKILTTR
jgi:hypothetical protein